MNYAETLGVKAKAVESAIATAAPQVKNNALAAIADALLARQEEILAANAKDLEAAVQNHMTESLQDRLRLTPARISGMANAARQLIAAEDPIGSVDSGSVRPNGLQILKTRVPLGVIGIIFESRPNVTVDAATLCLKAGNVVILRGGKEAIHSNTALAEIMRDAVETAGLPKDIIQLVEDTSRETAADMMHLTGYLDVLIPRGGAGLIQAVLRQSTVPVIETGAGNCHVYVDSCLHGEADYEMAVRIIDNAKTQRPSVCNAIDGLIVHQDVAGKLHPERTRSQVLLHLFSLVGALLPLAAIVWVYVLFPDQTDSNPVLQVLWYLYDLPAPLSFLSKLAVTFCAMTWCYTMVRTCSCVPISQTGSTPQQAAKQQLTMLWLSLPFFLLMLVSGVILLVYLLSFWWIFALLVLMFGIIFLPAIIFGAVMLGYVTLLMALPLLLYLVALLIPYVMGIVYGSRYLIACAPCLGWKKPWRIFLQVVMCLPWLRWIVTAITMEKMRKIH